MALRTDLWVSIVTTVYPAEDGGISAMVNVYVNGTQRWRRSRLYQPTTDAKTIGEYLATAQAEAGQYVTAELDSENGAG